VPVKRRKLHVRSIGISDAAIAAWRAGDYWCLHHALHLKVWQMPDWNEDPPEEAREPLPGFEPAPDTANLKARLIEVAGPPPRRWRYRRDAATAA
jgi:hypothetical protein